MKMMSDGGSGEDGAAALPELSGLMDAMGEKGGLDGGTGVLPSGKGPFGGGIGNLDVSLLSSV